MSNLLSSGFRQSLDQLIQSYAQRQEHVWDFEGQQRPLGSGVLNEDRPIEIIRMDEATRDERPQPSTIVLSDDFPQPQQREWQQIELAHHNWSQQAMHRSEFVSHRSEFLNTNNK